MALLTAETTSLFSKLIANTTELLGMVGDVSTTVFNIEIVQIFLGITLVGVAISLLGRMVKKFKR